MIGEIILKHRLSIGIVLLAFSAFMGYEASRVTIATSFVDFFPRNHPYVELYHEYSRYGGAQTLALMVQVKKGDIFNSKTLTKIQDITFDLDRFPAIHHQSIRSLGSYRVTYAIALPGNLVSKAYMYPDVPKTAEDMADLKRQVFIHRHELGYLVSADFKSAAITASFDEGRLDYRDLFQRIQKITKKYEDPETDIYAAGEPMIRGYGYYYMPVIVTIFLISVTIMILILYLCLGHRGTWWAPLITGSLSAVWGLGFVGLMGYDFDPVMLVIPFILTARDMSHGIQWQGRYYNELDATGRDKFKACALTTSYMLPPGLLSILADIAGIIFISFGGIPVLQHIALAGSVWLAGSLTMVFIFQPILMSYLPTPGVKPGALEARQAKLNRIRPIVDRLASFPVTPGRVRGSAIVFVAALMVVGLVSGLRAKIGYTEPGTPLYRHNAKVNQEMRAVGRVFPLDEGWVIIRPNDPNNILASNVLRLERDLVEYLREDPDVARVIGVAADIIEPFNQMFHYGDPKFRALPITTDDGVGLFSLYAQDQAPGEAEQWLDSMHSDTILRVLLKDHTYQTLKTLQERLAQFVQRRAWDPTLPAVKIFYLGGLAGLYAAANDVLSELDFLNITFVLGVIFLFCVITYRSFVAGLLFVMACVAANFGAFIYMRATDIGITIDTIPVISLGIGLGVDYGIYTVSRILDECRRGEGLEKAITMALTGTGAAVLATFSVIVGGMVPWVFSPLLFHNEMSVLLIILMFTNVIMGLLILPAYIAWARPRFIFRSVAEGEGRAERIAATSN